MRKVLLAAAALLSVATASHASIIPTLQSVTPSGSLWSYNYQGTLAGDQGVTNGSKLVIFDFAGFSGFGPLPANVTGSTQLSSGVNSLGGTDDPGILNLVFTYNGPDFRTSGGEYPDATQFTFSALSTFNQTAFDGFYALAVKNNGLPGEVGSLTDNSGRVAVPIPGGVPEPASWALMIMGFGGVGALVRRRRNKSVFA